MERRGYADTVCGSEISISRLWETTSCGGPFTDMQAASEKGLWRGIIGISHFTTQRRKNTEKQLLASRYMVKERMEEEENTTSIHQVMNTPF